MTSPNEIQTLLTTIDVRVQKFGEVLQTLQNDQVLMTLCRVFQILRPFKQRYFDNLES